MFNKKFKGQLRLFATAGFILLMVMMFSACSTGTQATTTPTASVQATGTNQGATSATPMATGTQQVGIPVTGGNQTVKVIEKNYKILISPSVVPPGEITFNLTNQGPSEHEFIIFKTDLAEGNLPVQNTKVVESSPKLKKLYSQEQYPAGTSKTAKVKLDPGHYVIICNVPGHYQAGMHTTLIVTNNAAPTQTLLAKTPFLTPTPNGTATPQATATGKPVASVQVIEKDFAVFINRESVPSGKIQFDLRNEGVSDHDFEIIKTDLAADNLPVENAMVNLKAKGLQLIASQKKYPPGETRTLTANLDPGHYVLISNLEDHYEKGMHVGFMVTASQTGGTQTTQTGTPQAGIPVTGGTPTPQATATPAPLNNSSSVTKVRVIEKSYAIMPNRSIVPAGKVEFDLSNMANMAHEFVIFKTDLAGNNLPTSNGQVDENSPKLTKIDEQDKYPGGETRTLAVNLDPGHYVLICNLPGHYQQDMYFNFTVE